VVAYDFGIKRSILRELVRIGCTVTVVPAKTPAKDVLILCPDGIFLSNGPGDPEPCTYAIDNIRVFLKKRIPLFGICLGFQLLALAEGASTFKMKFGHHGANHPVQDLKTGRVWVTAQNHGFAVNTLPRTLKATHISLFDGTLQGFQHREAPAIAFQGHPEAGPGPKDATGMFELFRQLMDVYTCQKEPI
jgi:carbamoyl-phosphate synthase small subunit